jgi:streptomycin 6-kinase
MNVGQTSAVVIVPKAFAAATGAREGAEGEEWIEALPALVERLLIRWHLHVAGPTLHGYVALVVPVLRPDRTMAMLKVSWVDQETRVEAVALAAWGGVGAVTLLESAPQEGALLLERLEPHASLQHLPEDQAVAAAAALLPQLHVTPPDGLNDVADLAHRRQSTLRADWEALGCPGRRDIVEQAVATLGGLAAEPGPVRLLHGDYHYANVLARPPLHATGAANGGPHVWAAIDPKPLVGDAEYDLVPLLRNRWDELVATGDTARACRRRLHAITELAGLDRERAEQWCSVRSVDDALWAQKHRAQDLVVTSWGIAEALQ